MANLNKVMLMGNITRDPELKYMPNQTAVCDFGLAVNRTWTGQDGVKKEEVTFVDCTCFAKTAEILTKYKKKGDPLFVEGRLKLDTWEAQDGGKRSKLRVIVENFQFLNRAALGGPGGQNAGGGPGYDGGEEYSGEPTNTGGGYNQQPRGNYNNNAPRPAGPGPGPSGGGGGQQRYNQGGRPAGPQPQRSAAPAPQAAPDYDAPDAPSPDDTPPIANDDIPF